MQFPPIPLLFVKAPCLALAEQQEVTSVDSVVQQVWMPGTGSARKARPDAAFTHTAALVSLCPFFPGWQGAMPYHKASIVGT